MKKVFFILFTVLFLGTAPLFAQTDTGSDQPAKPKLARHGSFEILQTENGRFYMVLKASNGQRILTGFFYSKVEKAKDAVGKIKERVGDDANFDIRSDKQWYFFIKGEDGKAIAQSERYTTEAAMKKGIESVKKTAPEAALKTGLE
jgi:uncharacterized protein YegP (UPF0339 family)